ncbi:MAG TPA: GNAT family N-acetyltransferase [Acidobacteriaceae bacterium]
MTEIKASGAEAGLGSTRSKAGPEIAIQPLRDLDGFGRCVELQLEIWGYDEADVIPRRMFLVAQRAGGQAVGAFDASLPGGAKDYANMIGFAMSIPGYRNGHSYIHSHMLAVRAGYRDYGIGRRLKLAQRDDALARGIDLIEWTFDPLEIKNAYFNIERLGAITRRYVPNLYGEISSELQGGLPTDRLYAEWWLRSKRVEAVLAGETRVRPETLQTVRVPHEIYEWKRNVADRTKALTVQAENRAALQRGFSEGLSAVGYGRDADGNGTYQLGHWDEELKY